MFPQTSTKFLFSFVEFQNMIIVFVYLYCIYVLLLQKKKKTRASAWVKNSKVMPQLPHYLSFLLGKGGKLLHLNPSKNLKTSQSALSDHKSLQCTCLDPQYVCDTLQNCPFLQNHMYILHEFCTFPVTEGNKILYLHFSSQLHAESSFKIY